MAQREPSDSESEESKSNEASSGEEEQEEKVGNRGGNYEEKEESAVMPDYERQRLEMMAENRARMEALGLHTMASSLISPAARRPGHSEKSARRKGKRKSVDDEDYEPDQDEGAADDDDDQVQDSDDDFLARRSSSKPPKDKNNKGSISRKGVASKKKSVKVANFNEDEELMQAIELSLKDSLPPRDKKAAAGMHGTNGKTKNQKFSSRVKMTEDDLIMHFFQFDERGSGVITRNDLQRIATQHDFTWSDKELSDMLDCFDDDGDGKLNLADFRKVVKRCNMLRESE